MHFWILPCLLNIAKIVLSHVLDLEPFSREQNITTLIIHAILQWHVPILQWVYWTTWPAVERAGEAHVTSIAFPLSFPCDAHIPHLSSLVRQSDLCSRPVHTWIKLTEVFSFACSVFKMPTYTLQQRVFLYNSYVITSSCREVVRRFQANYPGVRVPSREAVRLLVTKFRETG